MKPVKSRYGMMLVLRIFTVNGERWCACCCDCGTEKSVRLSDLRTQRIVSCGCYGRKRRHERTRTHGYAGSGKSRTTEYRSWAMMKSRCSNKKLNTWKHYGGRGIKVCDRWMRFENFISDMGPKPSQKHCIERKNNDGDYTPDNCRWATMLEQSHNTRRTLTIDHCGRTMTVAEWARETGITVRTLYDRYHKGLPLFSKLNLCTTRSPRNIQICK